MESEVITGAGIHYLSMSHDDDFVLTTRTVVPLIEKCLSIGVSCVLAREKHLPRGFFQLQTLEAGEILQKLRTYGIRLAVVADNGEHYTKRFKEMLAEENRRRNFGIFADKKRAEEWFRDMKTTVTKRDLADLSSDDPRVKYGRAKSLAALARESPEQVYPHLKVFVSLLKGDNNILKWNAIDIIGYLSAVDKKKRIDRLLGRLSRFLEEGKLITANHAIAALAHIALAKHEHQERITQELLQVEHLSFETEECRNIALGKVILALGLFCTDTRPDGRVVQFVRRQTNNSRSATRKKAQEFLKGIGKRHKKGKDPVHE